MSELILIKLPNNPSYDQLLQRIYFLEDHLIRLKYQNEQYRKILFGVKSEKYEDGDDPQMPLFKELIHESKLDQKIPRTPANDHKSKKPKKRRITYPENIQRQVESVDVKNPMCQCGQMMPIIGYRVQEELSYIPESFFILERRLLKRACTCKKQIACAPVPLKLLPKVSVSDALLIQMVMAKCLDRQTLYHLEKRWQNRHGIFIPRDNMSRWFIHMAEALQPIYNLMQDELTQGNIASMDATSIQVLKEPNRKAQTKSKMWCFIGGTESTPVTLFQYCATEHVSFLKNILSGFKGYIHGDADPAYRSLYQEDITMVYCHAHNRRNYYNIMKSVKKEGIAKHIVMEYKKLYAIEGHIKGLTPSLIQSYRVEHSLPILNQMYLYLTNHYGSIPPKSTLGKAVAYTLKHWYGLTQYIKDGRLLIDNNHTERIIRQFVMARNNFLFADTVKGAKALGIHMSLIHTAIANGLEPFQYYTQLLKQVPYCKTVDDYEKLMPWYIKEQILDQSA